ncbi:MAG TPA: hypothetical protein DD979_08855 [Gammaproteobacteria bacterium]|jgi:uncharacterized membrane protein|nr:hypothetical protein [Gammaproteobacteria bacterium]
MTPTPQSPESKANNLALLVYLLQLLSVLFGVTLVMAIIINHSRARAVEGCLAASHFRWQIITFWVGAAVFGVGLLLGLSLGIYPMLSAVVWLYYRAIKGWLYLRKNRPAPAY